MMMHLSTWRETGIMDSVVFSEEQRAELHAAEAQIKRRVAIGAHVSERKLVDELVMTTAPWLLRDFLFFCIYPQGLQLVQVPFLSRVPLRSDPLLVIIIISDRICEHQCRLQFSIRSVDFKGLEPRQSRSPAGAHWTSRGAGATGAGIHGTAGRAGAQARATSRAPPALVMSTCNRNDASCQLPREHCGRTPNKMWFLEHNSQPAILTWLADALPAPSGARTCTTC